MMKKPQCDLTWKDPLGLEHERSEKDKQIVSIQGKRNLGFDFRGTASNRQRGCRVAFSTSIRPPQNFPTLELPIHVAERQYYVEASYF